MTFLLAVVRLRRERYRRFEHFHIPRDALDCVTQDKETLDSFVKVNLLCGEKRVKKKKTAVRKATTSPVWNEAMSFNVPANYLASSAIEVDIRATCLIKLF